jgi:flagellin-like protein
MKGISPLVASVLLIAITMSVAGILAFWVSSYTSQTLPKVNRSEEECRFSNFEIWSCNLNTQTGKLTFTLHNIGQYDIEDLRAFIVLTDNTVTSPIPLNSTLLKGEYKSFILENSTTNVASEKFLKLIIGTGLCPTLTVESGCMRS